MWIPCQKCGDRYDQSWGWWICDTCGYRICPSCLNKIGFRCPQCIYGHFKRKSL